MSSTWVRKLYSTLFRDIHKTYLGFDGNSIEEKKSSKNKLWR